jgi:hypothetical protein
VKPHSQILFWLLVAATLAVDAVALAWLVQAGPMTRAAYLFDALVSGQLAVVCIWAVFAARRMWLSLLAIAVAVIVSTALDVWAAWMNAQESFGIYAALAAAIVTALWILKQTPFWRRTVKPAQFGWQFSIGQVLVVMTIVALLLASLRNTELVAGASEWKYLAAVATCDVLIVLVCVLSSILLRDWWVRLAAACAAAIVLGVAITFTATTGWLGELMIVEFNQEVVTHIVYLLVIAMVIFAWLELAPILPVRRADAAPPADGNTI